MKTKSKQFRTSLCTLLMCLLCTSAFAQHVTVRGTVTDQDREPVIGASVVIKGVAGKGTITEIDGTYTLSNVPAEATLIFSYIGMTSEEVAVNGREQIDIVLHEESELLSEVVVVGYGTQKKVNLTGSVATVENKFLENRPITNVSAGLAGLLPGVYVNQKSGLPGGDNATIRIRGVGTLNNANPMVIVDGVESSMNYVNAEDIASVSVLKDAASSAIYGSKAANGVILITTKKGTAGKSIVSYSNSFGFQSATRLPEYLGSADYAELYNEALVYDGKPAKFSADDIRKFRDGSSPATHPNTDWQKLFYTGSGFQTSHNLSFSGGDQTTTYRTALNYQKQDGIIKHTGKEQYNVRTNITTRPLSWISSNVNLSYTRQTLEEPNNAYVGAGLDQMIRQINRISPWIPYKHEDGTYGTISDGNPVAWLDQGAQMHKKKSDFLGIASLEFFLMEGLTLKTIASYKAFNQDNNEKNKELQYNATTYHGPTKMTQQHLLEETITGDILLNYDKSFNHHTFAVMGGYHVESYHRKLTWGYKEGFPSTQLDDLDGGADKGMKTGSFTRQLNMISWFGRLNYSFMDRYLFEANIRRDASSRFAKGERWGNFPSLSAAWRISEESFMDATRSYLDNLKIRASWGILGNQDALTEKGQSVYYPTVPTVALGMDYPFNSEMISGAAIVEAKNKKLRWEQSSSWGVGLDFTLLRKLNVTFDYYDRETYDIIMKVPSPETFALTNFYDNVGRMRNRGVEASFQYNNRFNQVGFSFGGNFSYNKNQLLYLAGQDEVIDGQKIRRVGAPVDMFYGYKTDGLYQSQEDIDSWAENKLFNKGVIKPGDLRYVDVNGDGKVTGSDRTLLGNSTPDCIFGFNIGVEYKGFDLMAIFQGTLGGYGYMVYDAVGGFNGDAQKPAKMWMDRWTSDNKGATVPRVKDGISGPSMPQPNTLDYWLRSTNYLRLKSLQVGYNLPQKSISKLGLSKARLYYSGQNIFTLTDFLKGWDPEVPSGRGSGYPLVMVNTFGLNITF